MIVYAQPGYALDWDWSAELVVWSTSPDRADRVVARHRLDRIPRSEADAVVAARRWWRRDGRAGLPRDQHTRTEREEVP